MGKILYLRIGSLLIGLSSVAMGQSVTLLLGSGVGAAGGSIVLPITIASSGGAQAAGFQWLFTYSTDITGITVALGNSGTSAQKSLSCDGNLCAVYGLNSTIIPDGTVAIATFQIASNSSAPTIPIHITGMFATTAAGSSIPSSGVSGTISLAATKPVLSGMSCPITTVNSLGTTSCTVSLTSPALAGGFAVSLSSNNGNLTIPSSVIVPAGETSIGFTATGSKGSANQSATVTAKSGGNTKSVTLSLVVFLRLVGMACSPTALISGASSTCTMSWNAATASAATILVSSNNAAVTVPGSVAIPIAGATTASFTATAGSFTTNGSAQITAALNESTVSSSLTLTTLSQVSALSCTQQSVNPRGTSACLVTLNNPSPGSGTIVALSSSSASVTVPSSVTAIAGATTASFMATAGSFTTDGSAQITAGLGATSQSFTIALNVSSQIHVTKITCSPTTFNGGFPSTCNVTLSGAPSINGSITLSSNTPNVTVPPSVASPSGHTSVQFMATSTQVDVDSNAIVTASFSGSNQATMLSVIGVRPTALTCAPLAISAGGSTKCTVHLNRSPAHMKAISLLVTSSNADMKVPQTLPTKSQQTQYSFNVKAATFALPGTVTLSVAYLTSIANTSVGILAPTEPTLAAPSSLSTTAGNTLIITAQAEDVRGMSVSLTADSLPEGASFALISSAVGEGSGISPAMGGVTGVIKWTPTAAQVGNYALRLGARSGAGTSLQTVKIEVTSQVPHIGAVVNAASSSTHQVCSPGSRAIIQGTALDVPSQPSGASDVQTVLRIDGDPAEIIDLSETHITFRCPEGNPGQTLALLVANRFGVSNRSNVVVRDAAPGIFTLDGSGSGQGMVFLSGTSYVAAVTNPSFLSQPAMPGDNLDLVITGLPTLTTFLPHVTIGQFPADVLSIADVPEHPGVQTLTVRVPRNAPVGDSIPVQVILQGRPVQSNTVSIAITQPEE